MHSWIWDFFQSKKILLLNLASSESFRCLNKHKRVVTLTERWKRLNVNLKLVIKLTTYAICCKHRGVNNCKNLFLHSKPEVSQYQESICLMFICVCNSLKYLTLSENGDDVVATRIAAIADLDDELTQALFAEQHGKKKPVVSGIINRKERVASR